MLLAPLGAQAGLLQVPADAVPFVTREYHSGNGLPQNTANAIAQLRDGHVLIGTLGGIWRFDGERMDVLDTVTLPGLRCSRIVCLYEANDGTLWIGGDQGGLTSLREGKVRSWVDLPYSNIRSITADAEGRILVATAQELLRLEGERFAPLHAERLRNIGPMLRRANGDMLLGNTDGLWQLSAGGLQRLAVAEVSCLAEHDGGLLVGTTAGLHRLVASGELQRWQPVAQLQQPIRCLLCSRDGAVWIGTAVGAVRIDAAAMSAGLPAAVDDKALIPVMKAREVGTVRSLFEDRDGGIWVGFQERGAARLAAAEVIGRGVEVGLPRRGTVSVVGDGQGGLFVGTSEGLLRSRGGKFSRVPRSDNLRRVTAMALDHAGTLWFASQDGLASLEADGVQLRCDTGPWPGHQTNAIVPMRDGNHWLAGSGGLAQRRGHEVIVPAVAAPLRQKPMRSLAIAADGALWVGGQELLVRIDIEQGQRRTWYAGADLPFGEVRTILPEVGPRALIATYGGGVVYVDGDRCVPIDERHGLLDQSLCSMVPVGGDLYFASNAGMFVTRRADFDDVVGGRARTIACRPLTASGAIVAEVDGGLQACSAIANGKLWFCGIESLYELDPARLRPLQCELPTKLEYLFVGESRWTGGLDAVARLGVRAVNLRLGTCTYDHPEQTRYRWRMLGLDAAWTLPAYERDVRFDSLPPGDFVFEAEAVGNDGATSRMPLRVAFHVPKHLYETPSFWILTSIGVVGFVAFLVRFGARRAARRASLLQAIVDERTSELLAAQQHLEQRVAERTGELQSAMKLQHEQMEERQRLERQLLQLQRMESIGQLAGGIAHDFNNLLTVTSGSGELLEYEVASAQGHELCRSIREACARGRSLTQHLLAVASSQVVTASDIDLGKVVADMLPVLRSLLGGDIALDFQAAEGPVTVHAAVTQIEQVLLNLTANARDAMPRGGSLRIRIECEDACARVVVTDTGAGMTPDVAERVFEPFFTTKQQQPGRGLGLATVYGILKQLGGETTIESKVGVGTTIRIKLPRVAATTAERAVEIQRPGPPKFQGRIVLIEDEPDVRAVIERLLRALGCVVRATASGEHAVQWLRDDPDAVDAVVSDVVMPGLAGVPLVTALRSVRPGLPIVFLSGHVDGRLTHQDVLAMGLEILQKPVDQAQLAAVLARLLAARQATSADAS